ncbi:hypothetical protein Bca4012_010734 [Brassica carinata]
MKVPNVAPDSNQKITPFTLYLFSQDKRSEQVEMLLSHLCVSGFSLVSLGVHVFVSL